MKLYFVNNQNGINCKMFVVRKDLQRKEHIFGDRDNSQIA